MDNPEQKRAGFAFSLGVDRRLFYLCILTWVLASIFYAGWMAMESSRPIDQTLRRFPAMIGAGFYWGILISPVLVPSMVAGWLLGWVSGGFVKLPSILRALLAAILLGGSAASLFFYFFAYNSNSIHADNHWRILVQPALWILPSSSLIAGLIIYVRRQS